MFEVLRYNDKLNKIWDNFINDSKNGLFMFYRSYLEYHKDRFEDCSIFFYDKSELIAVMPASIENDVLYSHGGLTFGGLVMGEKIKQHSALDCFEALKLFAKENNIRRIIYKAIPYIYFLQPAEEDLYCLFRNNARLLKIEAATVINLVKPLKMPKGRKAQIARAKREGVIVEESTDYSTFIQLENEVLKKYHNTETVHTGEEMSLLHSRFPEQIKLYVAKYNEKMIAGAVLFIYPHVVHTQYLAANDIAREIGALDYVIAMMIEKYRENKLWFDFGKSTEKNGMILNEGLITQKEGFGGRTSVYTTWELNIC